MTTFSPVKRWESKINKNAPDYAKSRGDMLQLVDQLNERLKLSQKQGRVDRYIKQGKLTGSMIISIQFIISS